MSLARHIVAKLAGGRPLRTRSTDFFGHLPQGVVAIAFVTGHAAELVGACFICILALEVMQHATTLFSSLQAQEVAVQVVIQSRGTIGLLGIRNETTIAHTAKHCALQLVALIIGILIGPGDLVVW